MLDSMMRLALVTIMVLGFVVCSQAQNSGDVNTEPTKVSEPAVERSGVDAEGLTTPLNGTNQIINTSPPRSGEADSYDIGVGEKPANEDGYRTQPIEDVEQIDASPALAPEKL